MNYKAVYLSSENDEDFQSQIDRKSEKRARQIQARKIVKKGMQHELQIRKDDNARNVRSSRPREVPTLQETGDSERF